MQPQRHGVLVWICGGEELGKKSIAVQSWDCVPIAAGDIAAVAAAQHVSRQRSVEALANLSALLRTSGEKSVVAQIEKNVVRVALRCHSGWRGSGPSLCWKATFPGPWHPSIHRTFLPFLSSIPFSGGWQLSLTIAVNHLRKVAGCIGPQGPR